VKTYYQQRAPEYDDWWHGTGLFAERERPGWHREVERLVQTLEAFPPARTLDVACGTGFLTRHLPGEVTGLDQSEAMLEIARRQAPRARLVQAEALALPFGDDCFDRIFTSHFYGHLEQEQGQAFLAEARRVASELVVADASVAEREVAEELQERVLNDGSRWEVYKRYFTPEQLAEELGGGHALFAGRWFVVVAAYEIRHWNGAGTGTSGVAASRTAAPSRQASRISPARSPSPIGLPSSRSCTCYLTSAASATGSAPRGSSARLASRAPCSWSSSCTKAPKGRHTCVQTSSP
jgi:demethylmenaquinone methyltransferase/2-methoxy-6-polyprenyl-1,4-benzoquinol methylase